MWSSGAWDHIHRAGPASALIHSSYCPHINTDCSNGGQTTPSLYNGEERRERGGVGRFTIRGTMSLIEWSRSTLRQGTLAFGGHQLLQGTQSCYIDSHTQQTHNLIHSKYSYSYARYLCVYVYITVTKNVQMLFYIFVFSQSSNGLFNQLKEMNVIKTFPILLIHIYFPINCYRATPGWRVGRVGSVGRGLAGPAAWCWLVLGLGLVLAEPGS